MATARVGEPLEKVFQSCDVLPTAPLIERGWRCHLAGRGLRGWQTWLANLIKLASCSPLASPRDFFHFNSFVRS